MSAVCSRQPLNSLELEILERTFSMGLYPDELLEQSCRTALGEQIFSISKFPFFVEEVQNRMYN
jgi:hypothetical protein